MQSGTPQHDGEPTRCSEVASPWYLDQHKYCLGARRGQVRHGVPCTDLATHVQSIELTLITMCPLNGADETLMPPDSTVALHGARSAEARRGSQNINQPNVE